ncbi:cellulose biosynthesis protein BcsG [Hylemonella sp. W303a]|uniref:cellulose biosynthesis protein BcsG n=1 Tax=Hylemonella sp. W303a TaxID=3389873 RepID=UPI00396B3CBC
MAESTSSSRPKTSNDLPAVAPGLAIPAIPSIRLGGWSFYFIAKFVLYARELIGWHALENLAFAAALLVPLQPAWRRARNVVALPVAAALLYHDSWLPPFSRLWSQATLLTDFSADYLLELAGRFVNLEVIALLVLAWATHRVVAPYLRTGVLVMAGVAGLALAPLFQAWMPSGPPAVAAQSAVQAPNPLKPDDLLREFYAAEAQRAVRLPDAASTSGQAPFDIVFLHVCSLSWDDLRLVGLDQHPLWSRFDALFTQFNSAASYSGPSAIRIQRALCGQTSHHGLYDAAADHCYLFPNLKRAGYTPELAMNHDGHFDDFLPVLRRQGLNAPPLPLAGVPIPQRGFDNSPIHDDLAVLTRWLDARRQTDPAQTAEGRSALYYNTISLHDGNKLVSGDKLDAVASYRLRAGKLFDDINGFLSLLEQSGRLAVVVLVPEHGAALRGDKFQIAGLREMPTPSITTVPVGVKIIGAQREGDGVRIDAPSSYLALSQLLANVMARPPFEMAAISDSPARLRMADYTAQLPVTRYVADHEGTVVMALPGGGGGSTEGTEAPGRAAHYLLQRVGQAWQDYEP